ncbi:MAG: DUF4956 domain-containing protein [Clostridia bacterium]|nr:DUF4956 domain-containing protein [Clostridia bacterium]
MREIFAGIFDTGTVETIKITDFLWCIGAALLIGVMLSCAYSYRSTYTKSFIVTLSLLPSVVCVVIMMVNGNLGAGVAVAGAFSLVRFRSVPGSGREIVTLFLAMGAGLITGMGYIAYALLFSLIMCVALVIFSFVDLGSGRRSEILKTVKITIPEDLDYCGVFEDVFERYTKKHELIRVKTTNMGSMYRLTYNVTLRERNAEKEFIDSLRVRNGNLEIALSSQDTSGTEL